MSDVLPVGPTQPHTHTLPHSNQARSLRLVLAYHDRAARPFRRRLVRAAVLGSDPVDGQEEDEPQPEPGRRLLFGEGGNEPRRKQQQQTEEEEDAGGDDEWLIQVRWPYRIMMNVGSVRPDTTLNNPRT